MRLTTNLHLVLSFKKVQSSTSAHSIFLHGMNRDNSLPLSLRTTIKIQQTFQLTTTISNSTHHAPAQQKKNPRVSCIGNMGIVHPNTQQAARKLIVMLTCMDLLQCKYQSAVLIYVAQKKTNNKVTTNYKLVRAQKEVVLRYNPCSCLK